MAEKLKFTSETLKRLREECNNVELLRNICAKTRYKSDACKKFSENGTNCESCKGWGKWSAEKKEKTPISGVRPCDGTKYDASIKEQKREYTSISLGWLCKTLGWESKGSIINWENGSLPKEMDRDNRKIIRDAYKKLFNVEFEDEEDIGENKKAAKGKVPQGSVTQGSVTQDVFSIAEPVGCDCLERDEEIEKLRALVKENNVVVVCADGGVGKTTLANRLLWEEKDSNIRSFKYYQTVVLSEQSFDENEFIKKIELTDSGKELLESRGCGKEELVCNELRRIVKAETPLFVIDGLDVVDIGKFEEMRGRSYAGCKFIITTRRVKNKDGATGKKIIHLDNFSKKQALKIFNNVRKIDGNALLEKDEDIKIFNEEIYPWCEGNAEVLYFIAKMMSYVKMSSFEAGLRKSRFEANVSRGDKKESTMAEKLKRLFGFENYLPDFNKTDWDCLEKEQRARMCVLSILSATRMNKVSFDILAEFLTEKKLAEDEFDVKDIVDDLEKHGFIKRDTSGSFYMHDLMANAMELNGIENCKDNDIKVLPYLLLWDKKIYEKLGLDKIESLRVPSCIDSLKEDAFKDNKALKSVFISKGVTSIGAGAFEGCTSLEEISFEENSELKKICARAFSKTALRVVENLPESLKEIEEFAFKGCESLVRIFIPKKVLRLKANFVDGCYSLESIGVDEQNGVFCSILGNLGLRAGAKSVMVRYAPGQKRKDYRVFAQVIGKGAFADARNLKFVSFDGVEEIGDYAFANCTNLKDFHVSGSFPDRVGRSIFKGTQIKEQGTLFSSSGVRFLEILNDIGNSIELSNGTLKIGKDVGAVPYNLISKDVYLERFLVDDENENYASIDGNLYTKDKKTLLKYAHDKEDKEFTVPLCVEEIDVDAFIYAYNLKKVIITRNVKRIGNNGWIASYGLEEFAVAEDNLNFKSTDGILYNYEGTELLCILIYNPTRRLQLPQKVKKILSACRSTRAREIFIPKSIEYIPHSFLEGDLLESITVDEENATYSSENGVLYNKDKTALVRYPAGKSEQSFDIPSTVTQIQPRAFQNSQIEFINISKRIQSIGERAFLSCRFLKDVEFEEGSRLSAINSSVFENNFCLEKITIPSSIKEIGNQAFSYCQRLTQVSFEENSNLESIGFFAFNNCRLLKSIDFPKSVKEIKSRAFSECLKLEEVTFREDGKLRLIGQNAFISCNRLKSITIPTSVKRIEDNAFHGCDNLEQVVFEKPSRVEAIGKRAFDGCKSLKSITIPTSVKRIEEGAFFGCVNLEKVVFEKPSCVEVIGNGAFILCKGLKSITIPLGIKRIEVGAFELCRGLKEVAFEKPSQIEEIGEKAFTSCSGLKSITIPSSVMRIKEAALSWCEDLEEVVFEKPSRVEVIGQGAFCSCDKLRSIIIPASVKRIEKGAFDWCGALEEVVFEDGSELEYLADNAFGPELKTVNIPQKAKKTE